MRRIGTSNALDLAGIRYGRLLVKSRGPNNKWSQTTWFCVCDCGVERLFAGRDLRDGDTKSCGCLDAESRKERHVTHGHARVGQLSPEYSVWRAMHGRCNDMTDERYGGRGITVCERWADFEAFYEDMGPRPSMDHSIERTKNGEGYSKENCIWGTRDQQARNRRSNIVVEYRGEEMVLTDACKLAGLPFSTVRARIKVLGWDTVRALMEPVR